MRNLIFAINVSLDGCCDHTKFNPDDEVLSYFAELEQSTGAHVYGRKTYQLMHPYWLDIAKNPVGESAGTVNFADAFAAVPKTIVFSRTLAHADGETTRVFNSNLEGEIQRLKQEEGKPLLTGGVDLVSQLFELNLVDEVHLVVHPIVVGKGTRLFDRATLSEKLCLKLAGARNFKSGVLALHYVRSEFIPRQPR